MQPLRLHSLALSLCALGLLACGGSSPAGSATTTPAPLGAPLPGLPTDAWAVVPDGVSSLLRVDMNALRASPHIAFARDWTRRAACLSPEQESLIFERTETLIAVQWAGATADAPTRSLLVAKGSYREQDVASAVQLATTLTGAATRSPGAQPARAQPPEDPRASKTRHHVLTSGAVAAARIGESLLVLGDVQSVQHALGMADGKAPEGKTTARLYDGELFARSGVRAEIDSSSAVLITTSSERVVQRTGKALGSVGLPRDLAQGTLVVVARLGTEGLRLEGRVPRPSAASAAHAADTIRSRLGPINLLARFAGLPDVLGSAEVRAEAEVLHVALTASHDDLTALRDRLRDLIADQPTCNP